jgi:ABC-type lipoprotein release transport system permease subunit
MVGCASGACIGSALSIYSGRRGIDAGSLVGSFSAGGLVFKNLWQPVLQAQAVYDAVSVMCVVVIIATLYPAIKAARTDPVKAMSHV